MRVWAKIGMMMSLLGCDAWGSAATMEGESAMHFQIRDPKTHEEFFQGYEKVRVNGSEIHKATFFLDKAQKEALVEEAVYDRDSLRLQTYTARNSVSGDETQLTSAGKEIKVRFRPERNAAFKETTLEWTPDTFHGKVFDDLITRNWDKLLQGKSLKFDLILPFRLESRGFQILLSRREVESEVFLLQPQNILLRALVPRMEFHYSKGPQPQLKLFTGPSVIPIKGEANRMVEILYGLSEAGTG